MTEDVGNSIDGSTASTTAVTTANAGGIAETAAPAPPASPTASDVVTTTNEGNGRNYNGDRNGSNNYSNSNKNNNYDYNSNGNSSSSSSSSRKPSFRKMTPQSPPPPKRGLTRLQFIVIFVYFTSIYVGVTVFVQQGRIIPPSPTKQGRRNRGRRRRNNQGGRSTMSSSSSSTSDVIDYDLLATLPTILNSTNNHPKRVNQNNNNNNNYNPILHVPTKPPQIQRQQQQPESSISSSSIIRNGFQSILSWFRNDDHQSSSTQNLNPTKPVVMIVACTKSQKIWKSKPKEAFVFKHFLPSIVTSITPDEIQKYNIQVLLAYDRGDTFWEKQKARDWARKKFPTIQLNFISILKDDFMERKHRIPFNEACQAAYEYGADYIVRVNDDTEFDAVGWITMGITQLSTYTHSVGVVGPRDRSNSKILTHDMVHRTHLDIFDRYYPEQFDNWWIDDWMTRVYGEDRTKMDDNWIVINHSGKTGTMRYNVDERLQNHLEPTLYHGGKRIEKYLQQTQTIHVNGTTYSKSHYNDRKHTFCALGTNRIKLVEGPMSEFVEAAQKAARYHPTPTGPCLSAKDMGWHGTGTGTSTTKNPAVPPTSATTTTTTTTTSTLRGNTDDVNDRENEEEDGKDDTDNEETESTIPSLEAATDGNDVTVMSDRDPSSEETTTTTTTTNNDDDDDDDEERVEQNNME